MSVFILSAYLLNQMNWKSDEKVARRLLRDHSNPLDIPEPVFISYYRINKEAFRNVVNDIKPLIHLSSIPVELKLATTLRFLAEGGFQRSIEKDSHIACDRTTVSKILKELLNVLGRTQCPKWVKFGRTHYEVRQSNLLFYNKFAIPGVIGCIMQFKGCKIKALRAKTNTYIKTPVRGEEPVFVVTGRKEDVAKAKREILSAAEHFSLIRATRKPLIDNSCEIVNDSVDGNNYGSNDFRKVPPGPQSIPGQVTKQVRVPYRVVGLVVGPKGATIKHIQHQTQTYIVTPSRDKEPIFEVTGLPDNVESARKQIEAHIALRTGTLSTCGGNNNSSVILSGSTNDVLAVHSLNLLSQILNDPSIDSDLLMSLYKADRMRNTLECEEEIGSKVSETPYTNKINFNINCLENNSIDKQSYMKLLQADNIQFQNFNWTHQIPDYINYSTNNANLKKASESSILTDVDHLTHQSSLQKQHNMFTPSQSISSVNHQLQPSQKNQPMLFGNLGCYIQTINIANNSTASNNTSTSGLTHIKYSNSNTQNTSVLTGMARSCSSASSTASSKSANNSGCGSSSRPELINIWKSLGDSLDKDEGIGDSPNIWTLPPPLATLTGSHCSPSTSISPTDSLLGDISTQTHLNNIGMNNIINESHHETDNIKNVLQEPQFKSKDVIERPVNNSANQRRDCLICKSKKITAVLVPCGHNMFCMECANCICELGDAVCPVCSLSVYHAMRILA